MNSTQQIKLFRQKCQKHGVKLTPQRLLIYTELINDSNHPSADRIYRAIKPRYPAISIDTVHRTLDTFCNMGVAMMVEGTGIPKRFEGNLKRHHHARCVQCNAIIDFTCEAYDQIGTPPDLPQFFQILRKTVHLEGICEACQLAATK